MDSPKMTLILSWSLITLSIISCCARPDYNIVIGFLILFFRGLNQSEKQKIISHYIEDIVVEKNSDDFIRHAITFEPNVKVKDVVKELKKKNIDEIMSQKEYKLEIINPIVITERLR